MRLPRAPMRAAAACLTTACGVVLAALVMAAFAHGQGYPPDQAAGRMTVPEGFQVSLVAAEPVIRQPVAIDFDARGRLWVMQYLQYPNPAGLRRVRVDRFSRTIYDRVPEPPPRGPRGADRLTILDLPADGRPARQGRDFVAGLNLGSGFALGHGGVFVLQAPFLLFYPDRDRDGAPDGDPEVLLSGFGMDDAHSVANSLTWGPDGWLYGCQGSTVTARVRGLEFQQGVWRYHPVTRRFELFCEGGGNSWGLDFDAHGDLLYSTNVGGFCLLHGVQGAYLWKQFGKHGALHNPFAYGWFDHVPHRNFQGGHVTVGGVVYQGDSFPARYRGKVIAADLLGHAVLWHDLAPDGSSFRSAHGGELLRSNDAWFAPSDVAVGPDGAVYVADWHDRRTAHPDPDADWDRSNGRAYRIAALGTRRLEPFDVAALPSAKLIAMLAHPNDWFVRQARQALADRRDPEVILPLRTLVQESADDRLALQALWALSVSGGFNETFGGRLLEHRSPHVRRWVVRLLGDERRVAPDTARRLVDLARRDEDVRLRAQLACSARRLPAADGLPVLHALAARDLDGRDPHLPLLLWWGIEEFAVPAREAVLAAFAQPGAWRNGLLRETILPRLVRRWAAEGSEDGLLACARLLSAAPSATEQQTLLAALDLGLRDGPAPGGTGGTLFTAQAAPEQPRAPPNRREVPVPPALAERLAALWRDDTTDAVLLRVCARLGRPGARERVAALALDSVRPAALRAEMLGILGEVGRTDAAATLAAFLGRAEPAEVHAAALDALGRYSDADLAAAVLAAYPRLTPPVRARAWGVLLGRKSWAAAALRAVDEGKMPAAEAPADALRLVALHEDAALDRLVRKHWGAVKSGTPEEKLAEMRRLANDLRAGEGLPGAGRDLFRQHCAACHRLFGEGETIGPDLTHANRRDRDFLLASLVDPSAVIRKEYLSYALHTTDGRVLTGLVAEQTPAAVTLVNARNERVRVPRERIEALEESPVSLMPEELLKSLKPQELRDLFRWLQSDAPAASR